MTKIGIQGDLGSTNERAAIEIPYPDLQSQAAQAVAHKKDAVIVSLT